jgi:HlyD family secretion protein
LALGFIGTVLAANAINLLGTLAMTRYAYSIGNTFYTRLFAEYLHSDYAFHLGTDSVTLSRNVLYEAGRVSVGIVQNALALAANLATIVVIMASVVLLNPLVAVAAIGGLGLPYLLIYMLVRRRLLRNGVLESEYFAQRIRVVNESFGVIKEIIVLQTQRSFVNRFDRTCEAIARTAVSTLAISLAPKHVLECLTVAGLAAVAMLLSGRSPDGGSWLAQLTFIGFAAYRLLPALQQAFVAVVKIRADSPALENIATDLRRARAAGDIRKPPAIDPDWRGRPLREIELRGVSFRYSGERPAAVRSATLRIPGGAMVGFIGSNGSGKTTTVDMILGLLAPQSGQVEVDGIVLDDTNRAHWRANVAYVPQHLFLIDATVAENIALGVAASEIDRARLRQAARMASVDEFVESWPHGYEELVGERGVRLSGGQRQRIGIARALYRDASLLVLDEATNALDGLIEQELVGTLESLRGRRTIILIAHRLSTVRTCDLLFEFEDGEVVASGSYQQLLRQSQRLRHMVDRVAAERSHS